MSEKADPKLAAAERMYRALNLMPCACTPIYRGNIITGLSGDCIRCKAMKAWEDAREGQG